MLQKIGNRTKTVLGFLLFIPIIASFLIWGIGDMLKAAGVMRYAATVGNTTISTQELERDYRRQVDALKRQGIKPTAELLKGMGVAKQVLRSQIERELLLHAARDNGILINDAALANEIQKEKAFADEKGKFSRDRFKAVLNNAGITEQEFVQGLRNDMAIKTLLTAVEGAAIAPSALPAAVYAVQKTKFTAEVYTLPHSNVSGSRPPTEKELADYFANHQDRYQRPEVRSGVMAILSVKNFEQAKSPSAEELKKLYEAKKVSLAIPEERSVQFIAVPDEAKAKSIAERARSGEKLAIAATSVMGAPVPLKTMESIKPGNLPADLDKAIFKLPRGETSEPVKTVLGWYVMQITTIKAGVIPPMDRIKDKLVAAWRAEQARDSLPKTLNKLDDAIAGGETLEGLAKAYALQLRQIPAVDASGKGMDANLQTDGTLKPALAALFKQKQGEVGNVFELPGGDYAFLRVDEVKAAHIPPLTEIRDAVSADWKKANLNQLAEELARKLANDWRKSDSLADIATKVGASLSVRKDITRDGSSKKPADAIDSAILKAGAVGEVVTATDGKVEYIAKIRAITPPDAASMTPAALADARVQSAQWAKSDYVQIFLNALEQRYAVEVNEKAVKQVENMLDPKN